LAKIFSSAGKQWEDKAIGGKRRFTHQPAQRGGLAQTPRTISRKTSQRGKTHERKRKKERRGRQSISGFEVGALNLEWTRMKKTVIAIVFTAIIFGVGLFFGLLSYRWLARPPGIFNTATLLQKVQTLSQLVTVKYTLEKVVVLDDAKWYGDSHVILVAHGVVKAAINLDQLGASDIHVSGKSISVTLPRSRVVDAYLDDRSTEVVERTTGILRVFDKDLEQDARRQAVDELRLAALKNGILDDASARARAELTMLLYHVGFTDVDLKTK
jgi:hypothetical protein